MRPIVRVSAVLTVGFGAPKPRSSPSLARTEPGAHRAVSRRRHGPELAGRLSACIVAFCWRRSVDDDPMSHLSCVCASCEARRRQLAVHNRVDGGEWQPMYTYLHANICVNRAALLTKARPLWRGSQRTVESISCAPKLPLMRLVMAPPKALVRLATVSVRPCASNGGTGC